MLLARVIGQVWGARQAEGLHGWHLLVLQPLTACPKKAGGRAVQVSADDPALRGSDAWLIAADRLGAGPGELVLAAHGSRCRDLTLGEAVATKDVVIAIVDHAQIFTSVGDDR